VICINTNSLLGVALVDFDHIQGPLVTYQKNRHSKVRDAIEELLTQNNLAKFYVTASTSLCPRSIYFDEFITVISRCGLSMLLFFLDRNTSNDKIMSYWRRARILTGKYSKKGKEPSLTPKIIPTLDRYVQVAVAH